MTRPSHGHDARAWCDAAPPGSMMPDSRGRFMPPRGQYQGIMPCLPGIRDVLGIRDSRVGLPRLKLILSRGGVPGHILACDMLICPTDTRSKNMPTRQPPYIQPILDHHLLIVPPGWKGSKVNWTWGNLRFGSGCFAQNVTKMKSEALQIDSEANANLNI